MGIGHTPCRAFSRAAAPNDCLASHIDQELRHRDAACTARGSWYFQVQVLRRGRLPDQLLQVAMRSRSLLILQEMAIGGKGTGSCKTTRHMCAAEETYRCGITDGSKTSVCSPLWRSHATRAKSQAQA
ncbi:unnamed protein product [Symbiodinium natans]|uniref:Uncharacterized protein n=1 Tax=Symbiodinium natans TaxID=878477 RepID=A0A812II59_9DINO|nr:unnamed protein product [Symbiodinium natans]